jgi:hypothetical protein
MFCECGTVLLAQAPITAFEPELQQKYRRIIAGSSIVSGLSFSNRLTETHDE